MSIGEHYSIQKFLGKGGIGETFLVADQQKGGGLFAMKRVARSAFAKKADSLRREFDLLRRLDHPNIARVLEWGETDEYYFFIEEYVGGGDVFEALKGGNYNRILSAFVQILRALHFLHREKILHGDLKPENILVVKGASLLHEDTVKLIDFGLSQDLGGTRRPAGGSVHFLAPEILLEKAYDHRADLYALGVCLYRMTTGRYPFENDAGRTDRLVRDQIEKTPVEPKRHSKDLPQGLNDLVMKLLEKDPSHRPESAQAILELLNRIEGERFSILLRREHVADVSERHAQAKQDIRNLCAWAEIPLSREVLLSLTDLPGDLLDSCLGALEEEKLIRHVLWNGSYHFVSSAPRPPFSETGAPISSLLKLADSTYRSGRLREARAVVESLRPRFESDQKDLPRDELVSFLTIASLVYLESGDLETSRRLCERFLAVNNLTEAEQAKIWGRLGWIDYREGKYPQALKDFDTAFVHWEKDGDVTGRVSVENFRGMTHQILRDWGASRQAYHRGLALLRETDAFYPILQMNLASAAQQAEAYEECLEAYEAARRSSEGSDNYNLRARLLNNLANLHLYLGRLDQASQYAHASLKVAVEGGLQSLEGNNYLLLSVIADKEGRLEECRGLVEKASAVFQYAGTASERASVLLHEAYYWYTAGDDAKAGEIIADLHRSFPKETSLLTYADLLEGKILARHEPPDFERGAQLLKRVIASLESSRDEANLWDAHFALGRLLRRTDPTEAHGHFQKALAILQKLTEKIPEPFRNGFFRDRKREKILNEMND